MNQEIIGRFIAAERRKKNLTQLKLADLLGVTEKTIGNWEHARSMPDISMLKLISKELDVSVDELIDGKREKSKNIPSNRLMRDAYQMGKYIREKRQTLNITQYELSQKLNISKIRIVHIENGNMIPSLNILSLLCRELDINIDDLIYYQK